MDLLKRKPNRLKEYDYSVNGAYFITICTKNKKCILSQIVGEGLRALQGIIGRFKSYTTHKYARPLWQRSYHDHIVRGDEDYSEIWEYVEHNALKWEQDKFYVKKGNGSASSLKNKSL